MVRKKDDESDVQTAPSVPRILLATLAVSRQRQWQVPLLASLLLLGCLQAGFLLFHTLAELFAVGVGVMMFAVAWNARGLARDDFLLFIASGHFWVAALDLAHALAYEGMTVVPYGSTGPATPLWLCARLLQAAVLACAPTFLDRPYPEHKGFIAFGIGTAGLIAAVFGGVFPTAYVTGTGLIAFTIGTEYAIITLLVIALVRLFRRRHRLAEHSVGLLGLAMLLLVIAELTFTRYDDVYETGLVLGHLFKVFAYWLLFTAVVCDTLLRPHLELHAEVLQRRAAEAGLLEAQALLERRVAERTEALEREVAERARTAQALWTSERRLRETFDHAAVGIAHAALDGRFLRANGHFAELLGMSVERLLERRFHEITFADDLPGELVQIGRVIDGTIPAFTLEKRFLRGDGTPLWCALTVSLVRDAIDRPDYLIGVISDISERRRLEDELRQAAAVFENTAEGVMITDPQLRIIAVNRAFSAITGYAEEEVLGHTPHLLHSGRQTGPFYAAMWAELQTAGHWQGEIWNRRRNGEIFPEWLTISTVRDPTGTLVNYVGVFSDITRMKQSEAQLERLAHYDPLTGLPNRLLFNLRLQHALEHCHRTGQRLALLFIDLDRFKTVNDSLGHLAGDALLQAVAGRLSQRVRTSETLARLGGDEFVILLEAIAEPDTAAVVAQDVLRLLTAPFDLPQAHDIGIGASIGISLYPDDADDAVQLVKNADAAMYAAKAGGRNTYRFCTEALTRHALERLALECALRRALERDEFVLHFQPQFGLGDGALRAVEALLYWRRSDGTLLAHEHFATVADETGISAAFGAWMLQSACMQVMSWQVTGLPALGLAVNLSPRQCHRADLAGTVAAALHASGLPAQLLVLEIDERTLMEQDEAVETTLAALKALGVRLAIDGFGTGYSSLARIKRCAVDCLKIDASFVRDLPAAAEATEIAATIVAMAHQLHLRVSAVGVDRPEQLAFLREHGCDAGQGELLGAPLPAPAFTELLRRQEPAGT